MKSQSDVKDLQGDLDRLNELRAMNVVRENPHNRYNINKVTLNKSECLRDLGIATG